LRLAAFLSICILSGSVLASAAEDHGRLVGVRAGGDETSSAVELLGDRPLSFTTLQLQSPPRVVVDFADTDVAGAPAELSVEDGTIRRVAAAPAGARMARVVIELMEDAEFDVRAKGNRVEVRVPRIPPKALLAAKAAPKVAPPGPRPAAESPAQLAESAPSPRVEQAQLASDPRVEQTAREQIAQTDSRVEPRDQRAGDADQPVAQAESAQAQPSQQMDSPRSADAPPSEAPHPLTAEEAEAQKRASLPTVSLGEKPRPAQPPRPLTAAEKKRLAQEQLLEEQREHKRLVAEAEAQKRRERAEKLAAQKRAAEEAKHKPASEKRTTKKLAVAEKSRGAAESEADRLARAQDQERRLLEASRDAAIAKAREEAAAEERRRSAGLDGDHRAEPLRRSEPARRAADGRIAISGIDFRPVGRGEVVVRSAGRIGYSTEDVDTAVILHLPGTDIPRASDRHTLDTQFFGGPVERVVPVLVPGGIDLRIELRERAAYRLSQSGEALVVTFSATQ
jgi:hypothetical protein